MSNIGSNQDSLYERIRKMEMDYENVIKLPVPVGISAVVDETSKKGGAILSLVKKVGLKR